VRILSRRLVPQLKSDTFDNSLVLGGINKTSKKRETYKVPSPPILSVVSSLMLVGFGLIALAWIVQLFYIVRGNREVQPLFIGVYIVGVIVLAASDVIGGAVDIAYAELVTIIVSLLTLVAILVTKPKG